MLERIFASVLNMSLTASIAAALIICVRLVFRKRLPKVVNYSMWSLVLIRLLVPLSFASMFSLFNVLPPASATVSSSQALSKIEYIPGDIGAMQTPGINTGSEAVNNLVNSSFPAATPQASANPMQIIMYGASVVWVLGASIILIYCILAYLRIGSRLRTAAIYKNEKLLSECCRKLKLKREVLVYATDRIDTPAVYGIVKPRIMLPVSLTESGDEAALRHITIHELVHIKRFDYITKPISVLALCLHWFNPVVWLSFIAAQKDMELACDEKVISVSDRDIRGDYAASLINLAASQNMGGLLAFGESNIKGRIKSIVNYRKPGFWTVAAGTIAFAVLAAVLLTNPSMIKVNAEAKQAIAQPSMGSQPSSKVRALNTVTNAAVNSGSTDKLAGVSDNSSTFTPDKGSPYTLTNHVINGVHYKKEVRGTIKKEGISFGFDIKSVKVRNDFGYIRILPSASKAIRVEARVSVKCNDVEKAAAYAKDAIEIKEGAATEFMPKAPLNLNGNDYTRANIDFTIYVPKQVNVELVNQFGGIELSEINGTAAVECEHGDVTLKKVGGDTSINGAYGNIYIHDIGGRLDVENSYGIIMVKNVKGNTDIRNAYGDIEFESQSINESIVSAKTDFGEISSRKNLNISRSLGLTTAEGRFGSGKYIIKLETNFGSINIR